MIMKTLRRRKNITRKKRSLFTQAILQLKTRESALISNRPEDIIFNVGKS